MAKAPTPTPTQERQWIVHPSPGLGGLVLTPAGIPRVTTEEPWEDANTPVFPIGTSTIKEIRQSRITRRKQEHDTGIPYRKARLARDWRGQITIDRYTALGRGVNYRHDASATWPVFVWRALLPDLQAIAADQRPSGDVVQWAPRPHEQWMAVYEVGGETVRVPQVATSRDGAILDVDGTGSGLAAFHWRFVRVERASDKGDGWRIVSFTAHPLDLGRLHLRVDPQPEPFALTPDQWRDVVQADRLPALLER